MVVPSAKDIFSSAQYPSKLTSPTSPLFYPPFPPPPPPIPAGNAPPHFRHPNNMLGLNPHMAGAPHPFQSMLPGLHHAAAAAAAANSLPHSGAPPPHSAPHGTSVAAAAAAAAAAISPVNAGGPVGPPNGPLGGGPGSNSHPLHNVPLNMWPLIWNHISK